MTAFLQESNGIRTEARLQRKNIGEPLVMHTRSIGGFCEIHTMVYDVDDHLQYRRDYPTAAGTSRRSYFA